MYTGNRQLDQPFGGTTLAFNVGHKRQWHDGYSSHLSDKCCTKTSGSKMKDNFRIILVVCIAARFYCQTWKFHQRSIAEQGKYFLYSILEEKKLIKKYNEYKYNKIYLKNATALFSICEF